MNLKLTQDRVDAVVAEMVKHGVDKSKLVPQGYGPYCPIDQGTTEEALDKNRRVEFHILVRKGKDLGQKRGCEEATKKGVKLKPLPKLKPEAAGKDAAKEKDKAAAGKPETAKPGATPATPAKPAAGAPAAAGAAAKPATPAAPAAPAAPK
jgi:hypothetical protein